MPKFDICRIEQSRVRLADSDGDSIVSLFPISGSVSTLSDKLWSDIIAYLPKNGVP